MDTDITVIGAGVVGQANAYELSNTYQGANIAVLDKNPDIPGENQSSRSAGVTHAGVYYDQRVAPKRAFHCVRGNEMLYQLCGEINVPIAQTGKFIVAANNQDQSELERLLRISHENRVPGIRMVSGDYVREREPNVVAQSALWVPSSGIVEAAAYVTKLKELSEKNGTNYLCNTKVEDIRPIDDGFEVTVTQGDDGYSFTTSKIVNAAGLWSDQIAKMVSPDLPYTILPGRGEAAKFTIDRPELEVRRNVYPAPSLITKPDGSTHRSVGVHLTPTFDYDGQDGFKLSNLVTVSPLFTENSFRFGKEDYRSGLARREDFLRAVQGYFPSLNLEDIALHQTGILAFLKGSKDFVIEQDPRYSGMINLVGIMSPGLTAALSIARTVREDLLGPIDNRK